MEVPPINLKEKFALIYVDGLICVSMPSCFRLAYVMIPFAYTRTTCMHMICAVSYCITEYAWEIIFILQSLYKIVFILGSWEIGVLMASPCNTKEPKWIDKIRSEGAIPLLEPDNCINGWSSPPGHSFMVRGPEYFTTRVKIPAGEYLLKPLGFDWIKSSVKIGEIMSHPNCRVRKVIDDEFSAGDKPFVWAFNLQLPTKDNYSAVAYFTTKEPIPEGSLMDKFLKGDDAFKTSRLKMIANIVKGPWIVKKAVGEQAICIIGRSLTCKYSSGDNFIEVDIDIGSSMVASAIVHLAFGYISTLTVDLAFLIESQAEDELPEKLLGAFRFSDLDPASAGTFEPSSSINANNLQSSLPTRLWMSIGQGFTHILNPGSQEGGSTTSGS